MPDYNETLNPQIAEIDIGTRNLRKIKIYPLSMAHQLELNELITTAISEFLKIDSAIAEDDSTLAFITVIMDLIKQNLPKIVKYVTEEEGEVMDEISNTQAVELIEIVYEQNYKELAKKVKELLPTTTEKKPASQRLLRRVVESTDSG